MQRSEQILAGLVASMVTVYLANWLSQAAYRDPLDVRIAKRVRLEPEIQDKEIQVRRARRAAADIDRWREQSLPSDMEVARSLYQNWLLQLVERAEFVSPHIDSVEATGKKGIYRALPFTIRGRSTLEQLTRFLYDFYRADYLHQIQRLAITPVPKTHELDVTLVIDALVLPDAAAKDQLSERRSDRLAYEALADYRPIVTRNLFGEGGASRFDAADHAYLTAVLEVDGQPYAWFTVRTTSEVLKLAVGQTVEVGQFRGTVSEIVGRDVVLTSDDERWLITLGESLSQATALPAEY